MDIEFEDKKLEKMCSNPDKYFGDRSRKIKFRLTQIKAAGNLKILLTLPQVDYHPLKGHYEGVDSIDAGYPYRFTVQPVGNRDDPGSVEQIKILEWIDYH